MTSQKFDLSLYLVTSSSLLPAGATLESHVEAAIKGGVTIVQLREKTLETRPFIELGKKIHSITKKYGVPLLINDRVDVALAVGCEGLHIGWDDMEYENARSLLGPSAIIGLSVSNLEQASAAVSTKCDYVGIGPVYSTATKPDADPPLYPSGVRDILEFISSKHPIPAVAIGSINSSNVQSVVFKSRPPKGDHLAGVAVVSAIIASTDPEGAASELLGLFKSSPPWAQESASLQQFINNEDTIKSEINKIIGDIKSQKPLVHHITNDVVRNISANVALATGGSPIMSENKEELTDLANIAPSSAILLNMGTLGPGARELFTLAIQENNKAGKPVIFDPVGAGATQMRRDTVKWVLQQTGYISVIKGNEGEIRTVAGESVQMRGVDTGEGSGGGIEELISLVKNLALRERNVVVLTGPTDIISDGQRTALVHNGHPFQGLVTGVGCALGSVLCATLAVGKKDPLLACLAGIVSYNIAAENAAKGVEGPGTFLSSFVDNIYKVGEMAASGNSEWLNGWRVELK